MNIRILAPALAVLLAIPVVASTAEPATSAALVAPAVSAEEAEVAKAKSNRILAATPPSWLSGKTPEIPKTLLLAGHHGTVVVSGVIGVDGQARYTSVAESSGSPELDQLALVAFAAMRFSPAVTADGAPIPLFIHFSQRFSLSDSEKYSCEQFVRDMDWWEKSHPGAKWKEHEFFLMMTGFATANAIFTSRKSQSESDTEQHWRATIENCRSAPRRRFRDVFFR